MSPFSNRDEVTNLLSHSFLHDQIHQEFAQSSNNNYPLSCFLIDIDHFRTINEVQGYQMGDKILRECGALLRENSRARDLISRYGGEEFAMILPEVNYEKAQELANRLRLVFAENIFEKNENPIRLTISIGIASYPEDDVRNGSDLLERALESLSHAKVAGRNAVILYKNIVPLLIGQLPDLHISENKIIEFQRQLSEISNGARHAYLEASKALIMALENKDRFTAGHAARSARYSKQTALTMGMSSDEAEVVEHAALLHDIGKICIPDRILLKPGRLSLTEYEMMKQHPYLGYKVLRPIKFLREEALLVLHHHEWFNGEGYPCRLKGQEIPMGARVISVIDSYDTMLVAGGRYKQTMAIEQAVNELIRCAGTQFDPEAVEVFVGILKSRNELAPEQFDQSQLEAALKNRTSH